MITVTENSEVKILCDFSLRTDCKIKANEPDLVVVNKANKTSLLITDIACLLDINIAKKERKSKEIRKYQDLKTENFLPAAPAAHTFRQD